MEGLPILPNKYGKLRSIFKCVGKILKIFKYIDSGSLNADQESKEIVTQGEKV